MGSFIYPGSGFRVSILDQDSGFQSWIRIQGFNPGSGFRVSILDQDFNPVRVSAKWSVNAC